MKVLSVIIPTYNMEKYLRKCLNSLIVSDDNMSLLEVLVINDGSTDSSSIIAHDFEKKYPFVFRVVDKENGNYGSCINRGLRVVSGKYVKVLDADDYFDTKVLDNYLSFLRVADVDMLLTDYHEVNENGKITKNVSFNYPIGTELPITDCCSDKIFPTIQMHAITYKTSRLRENNYIQTEGVSYTDQEWIFLPVTFMKTFCYYKGYLYQYLMGREGQTVDSKVVAKNAHLWFDLEHKRLQQYNQLIEKNDITKPLLEYLKLRMLFNWGNLYKICILYHYYETELLLKFDMGLKDKNVALYKELPYHRLGKYYGVEYINFWRKKGKAPISAILVYEFINAIKFLGKKNELLSNMIRELRNWFNIN